MTVLRSRRRPDAAWGVSVVMFLLGACDCRGQRELCEPCQTTGKWFGSEDGPANCAKPPDGTRSGQTCDCGEGLLCVSAGGSVEGEKDGRCLPPCGAEPCPAHTTCNGSSCVPLHPGPDLASQCESFLGSTRGRDGGAPDGGEPDGGAPDGGEPDGGAPDAGDHDCELPDDTCTLEMNGGRCYFFCATPSTWDTARTVCSDAGYHLLAIGDAAEDDWAQATGILVGPGDISYLWHGFNDVAVEAAWEWENGEAVVYTNWHDLKPSGNQGAEEDCATISKANDIGWHDERCTAKLLFVCEDG